MFTLDNNGSRNIMDWINEAIKGMIEILLGPEINTHYIQQNDQWVKNIYKRSIRSIRTEIASLGMINLGDVSIELMVGVWPGER